MSWRVERWCLVASLAVGVACGRTSPSDLAAHSGGYDGGDDDANRMPSDSDAGQSDGGSDIDPAAPVDCEPPSAGMACVPEGPFLFGCPAGNDQCGVGQAVAGQVTLTTFEIDITEVTVKDYASCVDAQACTPIATGLLCKIDSATLGPEYPVNCVDWEQATEYCDWVGKRLPTSREWEKAARGTDGQRYPWGEATPSCELAVWWPDYPDGPGPYPAGAGCGTGGPLPVGSRPAGVSPYGLLDTAGNVSEWVDDDAVNVSTSGHKMLRGGAFLHHNPAVLATWELLAFTAVGEPNQFNGFRCARGSIN